MPYVLNLHILLHGLPGLNILGPDWPSKRHLRLRLWTMYIRGGWYLLLGLVDIHTLSNPWLNGLITSLDVGLPLKGVSHFDSYYYKEYAITNDFTSIYPPCKAPGCFYAPISTIFNCGSAGFGGIRLLRRVRQEGRVAIRCACGDWCCLRGSCVAV